MYLYIFIVCVNTRTSMIKTNLFSMLLIFTGVPRGGKWVSMQWPRGGLCQSYMFLPPWLERRRLWARKLPERLFQPRRLPGFYVPLQHGVGGSRVQLPRMCPGLRPPRDVSKRDLYVTSVFVIHVGGTRCVTWSIDRIVQRHACITWGVELILAIFFIIFLYV
jgi:hypothetical protein